MLNLQLYGNNLQQWLLGTGVLLGSFLILILIKKILKRRLLKMVEGSSTEIDDFLIPLVNQTRLFTLFALSIFLASFFLIVAPDVQQRLDNVFRVVLFLQIGFWGMGVISFFVNRQVSGKLDQDHGEDATTIDALGLVAKIGLWIVVSLVILDNLGVKVDSLIASLGIGGIAVALAVQNVLGDLFASLSIAMDKPFVIGDFVIVDEFAGTVEDIGLKSTRIRSLSGEELIFSNADLLNSRIRNFKRLEERRISFSVGVVYGTPADQLDRIPEMVGEIISPLENVRFDRVHLKSMGDFSLNYEVVYYVRQPDYEVYMDVQQEINLAIYRRFEQEGIEFAFPTQTLHLEK
ncbi:MAG: mechanosensitive ion channel family protein [Anaerolineales bacterium]|nr:mechanosensitive ion channel family protein [Anaerolineales bacterium]